MSEPNLTKEFLGDGVYAEVDHYGDLVLTTEDGLAATNKIWLDGAVMVHLIKYIQTHFSPLAPLFQPKEVHGE